MPEAFLIYEGALYFSGASFFSGRFSSPVSSLVIGIAERFPAISKRILRERVFTNYLPTPVCEGMIRISAKRMSTLSPHEYSQMKIQHSSSLVEIEAFAPRSFFLKEAPTAGTLIPLPEVPTLLNLIRNQGSGQKKVGALALGPKGELVHYAWNTGESNPTLHAELNLCLGIQRFQELPLPSGSTIWSTLEPCAMCAAQILNLYAQDMSVRVRFLEMDPGTATRNSCLKPETDLWVRAGKPEVDCSIHR